MFFLPSQNFFDIENLLFSSDFIIFLIVYAIWLEIIFCLQKRA